MNSHSETDATDLLPPVESPRRRWMTIVLALVIFLAGMASGAALTVVYAVNRLQFAIHHPEAAPPRIAAAIARRLDLDADQIARVEKILARRQTQIAEIRSKFQPDIVEQLDGVHEEVAAVLDDSQRSKWTALFGQFKERWLPAAPARSEE